MSTSRDETPNPVLAVLGFILFVATAILTFWEAYRPAAPIAAGLLFFSLILTAKSNWFSRALCSVVFPAAIGVALFAITAWIVNWMDWRGREAPQWVEDNAIRFGVWLEPFAELGFLKTILVMGALLVLGLFLGKWRAVGKMLGFLRLVATVQIMLVAFCSFSFFSATPTVNYARHKVTEVGQHWHELSLEWLDWEARAQRAELIGPAILEGLTQYPSTRDDIRDAISPSALPEEAQTWVGDRLQERALWQRGARRLPGFPPPGSLYVPPYAREALRENPLYRSPVSPAKLPSLAQVRNAQSSIAQVEIATASARLRVAAQAEMIQSVISSAVGEVLPVRGRVAEVAANAIMEGFIGEMSWDRFQSSLQTRVKTFFSEVRKQVAVINEYSGEINADQARARRIIVSYQSRGVLSAEDLAWTKKLPKSQVREMGFICKNCGRPYWTPGCGR